MKKIKNNDHRLSCRISHFSNYYQPSKLLVGGSNPPGRARRKSDGYVLFVRDRLFLCAAFFQFCHPSVTQGRRLPLDGIWLGARISSYADGLCAFRKIRIRRSMRARPSAGASPLREAPVRPPPHPLAAKADQHGPAPSAAMPGPFHPPLARGALRPQESRDFLGNFSWEFGKGLRRCRAAGALPHSASAYRHCH